MRKLGKRNLFFVAFLSVMLFSTPEAHSQLLRKVLNKTKKSSKKGKSESKSGGTKEVKGGKDVVSRNKMGSRFGRGFSNLKMLSKEETKNGNTYTVYYFGAKDKLIFKLYPRFVYDSYQRKIDGVYSDLFVNEGEAVYHIDELSEVIDPNGEKHKFTHVPSATKRVLKTADGVYLMYIFSDAKKVGTRYPYYASSKSQFTGPFIIAAPSVEKFDEWNGEKALQHVKAFEKRIKIGCFKYMPPKGKLHTDALAESSKQAIYKKLHQYRNNANLKIRRIVVFSNEWEEKLDNVTDEVTERELIAYYLYVNGDKTDINGAKIIQKHNGESFEKELVLKESFTGKFSKDIPVSLVNRYFK